MAESTEGIVLRRVHYSETSLVVHFYTPDFGQVGALAKGAKRPKSAFQGGVDLLTRNQIVFARSAPGGLATLMESALLDDYRGLRQVLERLVRAEYCAELVSLLTTEEDPDRALYRRLVETLERLSSGRGDAVAQTIRFELGILAATGYGVDWERCVACGRGLGERPLVRFSPAAGGVLCGACAAARVSSGPGAPGGEGLPLGPGVLAAARILAGDGRRAERLHLAEEQTRPLGRALSQYITYLVGRPPKMIKYLEGSRPRR